MNFHDGKILQLSQEKFSVMVYGNASFFKSLPVGIITVIFISIGALYPFVRGYSIQ